jgi:hypothetical protein
MTLRTTLTHFALVGTLAAIASGCVVAPRDSYHEGYYDRDHHRYYHERGWHDCVERDEHCR